MWFEKLTGFKEKNPEQVREHLILKDCRIISKNNNKSFTYGYLTIPTLKELKSKIKSLTSYKSKIKISEIVGDIQTLHKLKENNGATFQVASQFNLLEMVSPLSIPENGIGIYEMDYTQGPACAIACGAGTIYRNYFVEVNGEIGQSSSNQINCLSEIDKEFENEKYNFWKMSNGYALPNKNGLDKISNIIQSKNSLEFENLKGKLKVGIQWNTEVTLENTDNFVTQVFCSALPIAYSQIEMKYWKSFACLILDATYEATLYSALINYKKTKNNKVFLTLIGGGAFGNNIDWVYKAIRKAVLKFEKTPLDVKIVSFGISNDKTVELINEINKKLKNRKKYLLF